MPVAIDCFAPYKENNNLPLTGKHVACPEFGGLHQPSTTNKIMTEKTRTIQFTKEKSTKNTVKFSEVQTPGEAPIVGTLYVQKFFADDATKLKVTIEAQ